MPFIDDLLPNMRSRGVITISPALHTMYGQIHISHLIIIIYHIPSVALVKPQLKTVTPLRGTEKGLFKPSSVLYSNLNSLPLSSEI